jgi:hypothetical protein
MFGSLPDAERGDLLSCGSTQQSEGNPMRSSEDTAAVQLEALSTYLAFTPRDPSVPLSKQIARDAAAGDVWARRVMHSRILESPQSPQSAETAAPADDLAGAPLPSIAVTAQPKEVRKQARDAGQGVVIGEYSRRRRRSVGMPARRTVHAPLAGVAADFRAVGRIPLVQGWKAAFGAAEAEPECEKEGEAETEQTLP